MTRKKVITRFYILKADKSSGDRKIVLHTYLTKKQKMKVFINNKETETEARTLLALAEELSLPSRGVAVAIGNTMVQRTEWEKTEIHDGEHIIIIKAACGG